MKTQKKSLLDPWKAAVIWAAVLLVAVAWIAVDGLLGLTTLFGRSVSVTVPDLVGHAFTDGEMADPRLFQIAVTYVYDEGDDPAPPRTVLSQSPPAGAKRKIAPQGEPCRLALTVSLGRREIVLPDVRGMDGREARIQLVARGMTVTLVPLPLWEGEPGRTPAGSVLDMSPSAGQIVSPANTITLYTAAPMREPSALCPDVVELTVTEAVARLQEAGLSVGDVMYADTAETNDPTQSVAPFGGQPSPSDPWGVRDHTANARVIWQDRVAGTHLPRGTLVSLVVQAEDERKIFAESENLSERRVT